MRNKSVYQGELCTDIKMSGYTSWRVGGKVKALYRPKDVHDLAVFIQSLPADESLYWVGLGSNLLVRDAGINGTVINTQGCLNALAKVNAVTVRAEAGIACAQLARFSARENLQGGEFWAGIPGTVGGALAMNAGCFGSETWDWVAAVECMNRQGEIVLRTPADYRVAYRTVQGPANEWFIAGYFKLQPGNKENSLEKIRQLLQQRAATQPTDKPTCGSVFRNPAGDFAGRLIEKCGLKGFTIGGAAVSEKHANFIINLGTATATDIESLIKYIIHTVKQQCGVELQPEVHIIG